MVDDSVLMFLTSQSVVKIGVKMVHRRRKNKLRAYKLLIISNLPQMKILMNILFNFDMGSNLTSRVVSSLYYRL